MYEYKLNSPKVYEDVPPFDVHCHFCGNEYKHSGIKIQDKHNNPTGQLDIIQCEKCRRYGGLATDFNSDYTSIKSAYIRKSTKLRLHEPMEDCVNEAFQMDDYGNFRIKVKDSKDKYHYSHWTGYTNITSIIVENKVFIGVSQYYGCDIEPEQVLELSHYIEPLNNMLGLKELFESVDEPLELSLELKHVGYVLRGIAKVDMGIGEIGYVEMWKSNMPIGYITDGMLMDNINTSDSGYTNILGAVFQIYILYEKYIEAYKMERIVGDITSEDVLAISKYS